MCQGVPLDVSDRVKKSCTVALSQRLACLLAQLGLWQHTAHLQRLLTAGKSSKCSFYYELNLAIKICQNAS